MLIHEVYIINLNILRVLNLRNFRPMTEQMLNSRLVARIDLMISNFRLRKVLNEQAIQPVHSKQGAISQNRIVRQAIEECDIAVRKLTLLKANVSIVGSAKVLQLLRHYGQFSYENLEIKLNDFREPVGN